MDLNLSIIFVLLAASAAISTAAPGGESMIADLTMIHAIQGDGQSSPFQGMKVSIEAIVTADFQGTDKLEGFFVQEENSDIDDNIETSEGIYIYDPGRLGVKENVTRGDLVIARGHIEEFHGLTQMNLKEINKEKAGKNETKSTLAAHQLILPLKED